MKKLLLIVATLFALSTWNIEAKSLGLDTVLATTDGTVRAGAKELTMVFSSDFTGTVNGVSWTWAAGGTYSDHAQQTGDTLAALTYTVATGSIKIVRRE
jgi:hypothetical protein